MILPSVSFVTQIAHTAPFATSLWTSIIDRWLPTSTDTCHSFCKTIPTRRALKQATRHTGMPWIMLPIITRGCRRSALRISWLIIPFWRARLIITNRWEQPGLWRRTLQICSTVTWKVAMRTPRWKYFRTVCSTYFTSSIWLCGPIRYKV